MQLPDIILGQIDFFIILKNRREQISIAGDFLVIMRLKRLFADMIPEIPYKIIYLDTDTIVNGDLKELFKIDITDYELACVDDLYNWLNPYRWKVKHYFNSGVLLLNMKAIRKTKLFKNSREMVATKKMFSPDQDALNFIVKKKLVLPNKFKIIIL